MLKIVDYYPNTKIPFPLKELEKFGFEPEIINYPLFKINNKTIAYKKTVHENDNSGAIIEVNCNDRKIYINADLYKIYQNPLFNDIFILNLDIIFDLIQAGLVEKVEG